ncbi:MAG TPA: PQQ-binding-like beta-propeller repeat protein [Vicinamibacterales bacterium]|nr:PQQ-binding-like beta-propeller repeat protein [Vicinamibacterales bacterium]
MRVLRFLAAALLLLVVAGAVFYWGLGYRVQLNGFGKPRLTRVKPPEKVVEALEAHRARQRATAPVERPAPVQAADTSHESARVAASVTAPPASRPSSESAAAAAAAPHTVPTASAPYWIGFRGPLRDGVYREQRIRTSWPAEGLKPMWKQPVGGGYASFAVANGRAFTIEQRRAQEVVAAYDVETGRELWTHGWNAEFREWMGGDGPRATPAWFDGRVYALGATGELRALDAGTGASIWRVNILEDNGAANLQWGMAASPLVFDDKVVVIPGGRNGRSIVAYDRLTGERRWSALDDKAAYSSPMLLTLGGRRQIVAILATRVVGLTPDSGELLWEFPWVTGNDIHASQPVVLGEDRLLLSSSYGRGAAVIEVRVEDGKFSARSIWENNRLKNRFSSSVVHDGYIYGLDENILTCLDAATGNVRWKAGRYGHGQLVLADGHLIVLSEDGDLALVRANPARHEELVRFPVLEGKTWNHPAIDGGRLLVRNLAEMAAFDLRLR